jgi:hypothetical protein
MKKKKIVLTVTVDQICSFVSTVACEKYVACYVSPTGSATTPVLTQDTKLWTAQL